MRMATWNVNSLKVRLPHVLDWLQTHAPDVLCLQETKLEDHHFPVQELEAAGYHVAFTGQKAYNGVAILARVPLHDVVKGMPDFEDVQQRVLSATVGGVRVVCVYIPNGQSLDSEKYPYKLHWLQALNGYAKHLLVSEQHVAILGDYNIAPTDKDVYDPIGFGEGILVSPAERQAFQDLLNLGYADSFTLFEQTESVFTWWDYRMMAFRRNQGLRIDHILLSQSMALGCRHWERDKAPRKLERPSDHAPVWVDVDTGLS